MGRGEGNGAENASLWSQVWDEEGGHKKQEHLTTAHIAQGIVRI